MKIIILSKCLSVYQNGSFLFHFKGVYRGHVIRHIILDCKCKANIKKGKEYQLFVHLVKIDNGVILGTINKFKCLDDYLVDW